MLAHSGNLGGFYKKKKKERKEGKLERSYLVEGKATCSVNRDVIILEALASCLLPLAFVNSKIFFHNEQWGELYSLLFGHSSY